MQAIPRRHSRSLHNRKINSLHAAAIAWGIPYRITEKFSSPAPIKLVAIIFQITE